MKAERGFAFILVLILLGLGGLLIGPAISFASTSLKSRAIFGQDIYNDYSVGSAIEYALWLLKWQPGYAASLPIGQETPPVEVTVNGVTASVVLLPQAPPGQLSGAPLAGPLNDKLYFKVTKEVVPTSLVVVIATDGFETGDGTGGTGPWIGNWAFTGDAAPRTDGGPYDGAYHLRLRGDNDANPGKGYAERQVNISSSSGPGPYLQFWAKIKKFESGDTLDVRVSTNGTNWTVVETITNSQQDDRYVFHQVDLSSYGAPATFYLSFKANMNQNDREFYVDKIQFSNTAGVTNPPPGVLTQYTYYVSIQCMDPDGCRGLDPGDPDVVDPDLEKITDKLPQRGAASGDYLQYIPDSIQWDQASWGIAPFNPATQQQGGDDATRYQELTWTFNPDLDFAYGEVKTFNFKAQAALVEGVYCNSIWPTPGDNDFRPGSAAKIIVGNPAETRCSGALLEVAKTVDIPIINPGMPTVLTYIITIKNLDTLPIEIDRVEDWLPTTGVTSPTFEYVTSSARGSIDKPGTAVLFYDGFSRSNNNTVLYWTDGDASGANCRINGNVAELRGLPPSGCAITQSGISTAGHTSITLTYRWRGRDTEAGDKLKVAWKPSSSGTWNTLVEHSLNQTSFQNASWSLPATADNTTIDVRFTGISDATDEQAQLDWVKVSDPAESIAFDGFESGGSSGGTGTWVGSWSFSGDYSVMTGSSPYQGTYHLRLQGDDNASPGKGNAQRIVNLTGYSVPFLQFYAKLESLESLDKVQVMVSTNGTSWTVIKTFHDGEDDNTYRRYIFDLSAYANAPTLYVRFYADMDKDDDRFYLDNIEFLSNPQLSTPVCMPDPPEGSGVFFARAWDTSQLRWGLRWNFVQYPDSDNALWDPTGLCQGYDMGSYRPALTILPGETFTITFQSQVTLQVSGSYYNEVIVNLKGDYNGTEQLYSWPTGGVSVPQVDIRAETLLSILRANTLFGSNGVNVKSWHWKRHR